MGSSVAEAERLLLKVHAEPRAQTMGGCGNCLTSTLIFIVSTIFFAIGVSLTFGFTAAVVMPVVKVFVPSVVAFGGIAAGVLITLLSFSGYSGICCKKRCGLFIFMLFSFLIFCQCFAEFTDVTEQYYTP